jgi:hypothetical protein
MWSSIACILLRVNKSRMKWAGQLAHMGEMRNAYIILVGKPEEKRPAGKPKHRSEDNIKMDLRDVGFRGCGLDSSGSG